MTTTPNPVCARCNGQGFTLRWGKRRRCSCTPAPARGPNAAEHVGECGVCGRTDLAIDNKKHSLSLHGYDRPGEGWIVGRCPGTRMQPVELSPETIEWVRDLSRQRAEQVEATIANMHAGKIVELHVELRRPGVRSWHAGTHDQKYEQFVVRVGDPERQLEGDSPAWSFERRKVPSWEELKSMRLAEWTHDAENNRNRQARAEKRLETWGPQPLRRRDPLGFADKAASATDKFVSTMVEDGLKSMRHIPHRSDPDPDAQCTVCEQMFFSADGAPDLAICRDCWKKEGSR